jgi:PPK2 family polyphosphate:nucleotide phosphotransferase
MSFIKEFRIKPGKSVRLKDHNPSETLDFTKQQAEIKIEENINALYDYQYLLYAEDRRSLLIVLQGMDAAGKDGTIRHVMKGLNPQGCTVTPFKVPSSEELDHDFLWRIHKAAPAKGDIAIFNRSHYEDVIVARVRKLVDKEVLKQRYKQINHFEKMLSQNGTAVLKFFLHIDKDEQKRRLEERLKDPRKNWKFNINDLNERKLWNDYGEAYERALEECSTDEAPWYVVPANKKWFRNLVVSEIINKTLDKMDLKLPKSKADLSKIKVV